MSKVLNGTTQLAILVAIGVVVVSGVIGAIFSVANTPQILGFCSLTVVALLSLLQQMRIEQKTELAAVKVEEVKTAIVEDKELQKEKQLITETKLDDIVKTGERNHILLNSNMSIALKVGMVALRRVADYSKNEGDIAAAELAEKAYNEHTEKQNRADAEDAKGK